MYLRDEIQCYVDQVTSTHSNGHVLNVSSAVTDLSRTVSGVVANQYSQR